MVEQKKNEGERLQGEKIVLPAGVNVEKGHILIVDDEEDIRDYLKSILERKGFTVTTAREGEEGLKFIMNSNIHVVLCDIVMTKMDGLQFLKKVKDFNSSVEVIMITGYSNLDACMESIDKGACAYLVKPVNVDDVFAAIARAQRNIREKKEMIEKALKMRTSLDQRI